VLAIITRSRFVVADLAKELPYEAFPLEGGAGPDTYFADASFTLCSLLTPYPAASALPVQPSTSSAKTYCSSRSDCGGFIHTTVAAVQAAGGSSPFEPEAVYCQPQSFVAGTASATSGISYERKIYRSCDVSLELATATSTFYGSVSGIRKACIKLGKGLTSSADRPPLPKQSRRKAPAPKPRVTISSVEYTVGVEVFITQAEAEAASADGTAHAMATASGVSYYMPGAAHVSRAQHVPPFALDGFYPLYSEEISATAASGRGGGNGQATTVGPLYGQVNHWSIAPYSQTYYMPADGATLYLGDYVAPFELDGYYPLYAVKASAAKASSDGTVQSHGPGSDTGHPLSWSIGAIQIYYMPAAGQQRYYGAYPTTVQGIYSTLVRPYALGGDGTSAALSAAQAVAAANQTSYWSAASTALASAPIRL